ncbi:uncharacterized protein LOC105355665 isoform X2 [Oryzias latipes]|nr:uncharacterized protein LOC105355665 isoform X2 [Oryzias latipes]
MGLMFCRFWLLVLMMMLKNVATSVKLIKVTVTSGKSLVLSPDHLEGVKEGWDFRWTHSHLVLNNRTTECPHGRCELLKNGSVRFSQVLLEDSGNYTLEVFDDKGIRKNRTRFLVQVDVSSGSRIERPAMLLWLLLLFPLISIIFFILRRMKKKNMKKMTTGQKENNVYVEMKSCNGHKEKQREESVYVTCHPAVKQEDICA